MAKRGSRKEKIESDTLSRYGKPWTSEEIKFVMESELPDKEIAIKLGRTASAVTNARANVYAGVHKYNEDVN